MLVSFKLNLYNKTSELITCFKLEKKLNGELEYPILVSQANYKRLILKKVSSEIEELLVVIQKHILIIY